MQVRGGGEQALGYVNSKSDRVAAALEEVEHGGIELHPLLPISPHLHRAARLASSGRNVGVGLNLKIQKKKTE